MRIAIVYDCLYPSTVGGAERWLRALAEDLAADHEVTYVTRRQWPRGQVPDVPGVRVVAVSPATGLYTAAGRRRLVTPLLFALGVLRHFALHRRSYDVVHCVSYPYLPLIALRAALVGRSGIRVFCEWIEVLTPAYWRRYGGRVGGTAGRLIQALCVRLTERAFVFSELNAARLEEYGFRGELHRLTGLWAGKRTPESTGRRARDPVVLFVGRHTPDKQVTALPAAIGVLRERGREVRAVIAGDGPERPRVLAEIERLHLGSAISTPGFLPEAELEALMQSAGCVVAPSIRDGYGMAVVEAAAAGVPVVVCDHPDNAATEHVVEGVNGTVARDATPNELADAIGRVLDAGRPLRQRTEAWFALHRAELTMSRSVDAVRAVYEQADGGVSAEPSLARASHERDEEGTVRPVDPAREPAQSRW